MADSSAAQIGSILLTPNECRVAEDRPDCFWFYVVTNCASAPQLQKSIQYSGRFPWREVSKVQHYWLSVNALKLPMEVQDSAARHSEKTSHEKADRQFRRAKCSVPIDL